MCKEVSVLYLNCNKHADVELQQCPEARERRLRCVGADFHDRSEGWEVLNPVTCPRCEAERVRKMFLRAPVMVHQDREASIYQDEQLPTERLNEWAGSLWGQWAAQKAADESAVQPQAQVYSWPGNLPLPVDSPSTLSSKTMHVGERVDESAARRMTGNNEVKGEDAWLDLLGRGQEISAALTANAGGLPQTSVRRAPEVALQPTASSVTPIPQYIGRNPFGMSMQLTLDPAVPQHRSRAKEYVTHLPEQ